VTRARSFHLLTFLVTAFALVLQFVLVAKGNAVLDETSRPDAATRVLRYFSYLTIWANALVAWSTFTLALGLDRDKPWWRALRLNAVALIALAGIVHFLFLRPLLDLHGANAVADKLLHVVVPIVAVIGWVAFGPRRQADWGDLARFMVVPVVWVVCTLVRGAFVDWYPYPFIDVDLHGYGVVMLNVAGIAALLLALAVGAVWLDERLCRRTHSLDRA